MVLQDLRRENKVGEFLVVAPETDVQGATVLAERIRLAVERCQSAYNNEKIAVTVSLGFAVAEADVLATYDQMKHVAAAALSEAKTTGRNKSVIRPVQSKPEASAESAAEGT